jgi:hypothetical protein
MEVQMKAVVVLSFFLASTCVTLAQSEPGNRVLVDPDFGLTFAPPDGFTGDMIGQTPDGLVRITVAANSPDLPAHDPSGNLCDITFQYDPAFGQGDQDWVNALVDGTGFYESGMEGVVVPGTLERGTHFKHRGASAYRYEGQHEQGGTFAVSAIPSPEGFVLVTCASSAQISDWTVIDPVVEAVTMPGQPRDHLVASGSCNIDISAISTLVRDFARPLDGQAIAALDTERDRIAEQCDGLHAEAIMDQAMAQAGLGGNYRGLRYDALARIGSDLLTEEQHAALAGGRDQVVATSDGATGERYLRYMHFIVGLRSLAQ